MDQNYIQEQNNFNANIPAIEYAGFWRRFVACIVDGIAGMLVILPIVLLLMFIDPAGQITGLISGTSVISQVIQYLIYPALISLVIATSWQASPGKRLMKVFIVDNGGRIKYGRAFIRTYMLAFVATIFVFIFNPYEKPDDATLQRFQNDVYASFPELEGILASNNVTFSEYIASEVPLSQVFNIELQVQGALMQKPEQEKNAANLALTKAQFEISMMALKNVAPYTILSIILMFVWFMPVVFTKQKTAMHDIILGTRVIRGKAEDYYDKNDNTQAV